MGRADAAQDASWYGRGCSDRGQRTPSRNGQRSSHSHDLFVLASRDEPAAVSHLEAMAHSLPVVCSDANGTSCYVRHGENGFIFRSGDIDDLTACIERVIKDREHLLEMGRRSYELVLSRAFTRPLR